MDKWTLTTEELCISDQLDAQSRRLGAKTPRL